MSSRRLGERLTEDPLRELLREVASAALAWATGASTPVRVSATGADSAESDVHGRNPARSIVMPAAMSPATKTTNWPGLKKKEWCAYCASPAP